MSVCESIKKLINNQLSPKEYKKFIYYICNLTKNTGTRLAYKLLEENRGQVKNILEVICKNYPRCEEPNHCLEDVVSDVILKILRYAEKFKTLSDGECKAYLYTLIKNHLIDEWRRFKTRGEGEVVETDLPKPSDEENLSIFETFVEDEVAKYPPEVLEIFEDFKRNVEPEHYKYFCYFLLPDGKKLYRCLWAGRSDAAAYKDASRKKPLVVDYIKTLRDTGYNYETVELFIKTILSKLCEELRFKECKEEK